MRKNIAKERRLLKNRSVAKIYKSLKEAEKKADHDAKLISSIKSSNRVVLPMVLSMGKLENDARSALPVFLKRNSTIFKKDRRKPKNYLLNMSNPFDSHKQEFVFARGITPPFSNLAANARALGHINNILDADNTVKSTPLFISYNKRFYPSFALQIALKYRGQDEKYVKSIAEKKGFNGLKVKDMMIPTDSRFQMLIAYNTKDNTLPLYSFSDVMSEKVPAEIFRNKITLVGLTAPGIAKSFRIPYKKSAADVEITANVIENILSGDHIYRPTWAFIVESIIILFLGMFITFIIPRVKKRMGILLLGIFLLIWSLVSLSLFTGFGLWFKTVTPILLCIAGYAAMTFNKLLLPAKLADTENIESFKMLGLTLQSQGMLDMAFDKFMKCPIKDESVRGLLYNLGLDFERKRMFNKAVAVYEHIKKGKKYKDIGERIKKLRSLSDTAIPGTTNGNEERTMLLEDEVIKPTLGRYEVIEELGRGAMSTIYLGRDPKINRDVAIKTLKYESMDEEELKDFKDRFFREAEAAGTLSHPNIMTIYDIGEEHDMAYIAMELLKGKDLSEYTNKKNLLSVKEVLRIISYVAEALDYAHSSGVVHRDIKPANIMLLEDESIKVADFGIATVTTTAETRTGSVTIIGTPNYMSPEQVLGKKVDGRSDLFSLGCVMYELLLGEKPFKGDTIAALLQNISKGNLVQLSEVTRHVPDCCIAIVEKLLARILKNRYKKGRDVVEAIKNCMETIE